MTAILSCNLNKIALIRNSREGNYPNVVAHAEVCLAAGAGGITVHPRPDQRHIRPDDVRQLGALLAPQKGLEFNIEGNPFAPAQGTYPGLLALVKETRPEQVTLVPDGDDQLTSDHGFDMTKDAERLKPIIEQLKTLNCRIVLFMDPDKEQIKLAKAAGADRIELYTGPYALAHQQQSPALDSLREQYFDAAAYAISIGLGVNAGHDLNLENLPEFKAMPGLQEVSIGHALTVDALAMGLEAAVSAYIDVLR